MSISYLFRRFLFSAFIAFTILPPVLAGDFSFNTDFRLEGSGMLLQENITNHRKLTKLNALRGVFAAGAEASWQDTLSAGVLFNVEDLYNVTSYYANPDDTDNDLDFNVLNAYARYQNNYFRLTAGRQFYGKINTFAPYYGPYPQALLSKDSSSIDGVKAEATYGMFSGSLFAGKENSSSFRNYLSYLSYLLAAQAELNVKDIVILDAGFYTSLAKNDGWVEKSERYAFTAGAEIFLTENTSVAALYGRSWGHMVLDRNVYVPGYNTADFDGDALMLKLDSSAELLFGKGYFRFFYLDNRPADSERLSYFSANNFVWLGSIFTGVTTQDKGSIGAGGNIEHLQAYSLGGTYAFDFLPVEFGLDLFDIHTREAGVGTEMDLSLKVNVTNDFSVTAMYATFSFGDYFTKGQFNQKYKQYSLSFSWRF